MTPSSWIATWAGLVAPGVPVCRPEVSTTRAPDGSPAQSRAFSSAVSIISSTESAVSVVVG